MSNRPDQVSGHSVGYDGRGGGGCVAAGGANSHEVSKMTENHQFGADLDLRGRIFRRIRVLPALGLIPQVTRRAFLV